MVALLTCGARGREELFVVLLLLFLSLFLLFLLLLVLEIPSALVATLAAATNNAIPSRVQYYSWLYWVRY